MTNADKIRAMTDEEMADFINEKDCVCDMCSVKMGCLQTERERCKKGILKWLQRESEVSGNEYDGE